MRKLSLLLIVLLISACSKTKENKPKKTTADSIHYSSKIGIDCAQKDTITGYGTKIKYLYQDNHFKISWSNNSYRRVYDSLYTCQSDKYGLWDLVPKLSHETPHNLIFTNVQYTSGGGNPAPLEYYAIIFPKNPGDSVSEKPFFISAEGSYLVYGDAQNENIHLMNLETKKEQTILLKPKPDTSRSPTLAIQDVNIMKNTFFIEYESLDYNDDIEVIKQKFKIKI
jgi:hypothetical protein